MSNFCRTKLREFRNEIKSPIDIHVKLKRFVRCTYKLPTHDGKLIRL